MVRNILLFSGSSHPALTESICTHLGIPPAKAHLSKFSVGETRVEIGESVRGKDVFIVQSACSRPANQGTGGATSLNDGLMELLITISACKTASAKRVTAVLPLFPYSRQSDLPYNRVGAPLARMPIKTEDQGAKYTFESRPTTPGPSSAHRDAGLEKKLNGMRLNGDLRLPQKRKDTSESVTSDVSNGDASGVTSPVMPTSAPTPGLSRQDSMPHDFKPQRGYKQWVAQAGTLIADLLTCAGADHIITMDLHDPQYQGFFDIPVDNLYGRHLLKRYITHQILPHNGGVDSCVIVSPDAGGAKRATSIADSLGMDFALIHKERRHPAHSAHHSAGPHPNSALLLVGKVKGKVCILVDDLADTSNTITRAAKLLKKEGALKVFALVTHGVLSGDGVDRIFHSGLDKVIVTNSVPQDEHVRRMDELAAMHGKPSGKLEVLEVAGVFAEVSSGHPP
jgi:ribose-phosphate pyrophosphokinase